MSRWQDSAACRDDPLWDRKPRGQQLADCDECPVRFQCLQAALADEEAACRKAAEASKQDTHPAQHLNHLVTSALPIYGGYTIQQRALILRSRMGAATAARIRSEPGVYDTCGTPAGAVKHTRLGERRCEPCSAAAAADRRARRQAVPV